MATVARLPGGIRVRQFLNDHDPPHFHVAHADAVARIRIADLTVLDSTMSRSALSLVIEWEGRHQAELALNWVLARARIAPREIGFP